MRLVLHFIRQCAIATLCLSFAAPAYAQRSVTDKAAAEALFDEALELMKDKRYTEACPKLEESQRIDAGIGTLLYLAECYEKSGRTASAWATFREAASAAAAAGQAERARQGKARADKLEESLSKLTIQVASQNRSLQGFQVTRGGEVVQAPLYDSAVPVDPGEHVIEATAPGYAPFSKTVNVPPDNGRALLEVPALTPLEGGAAAVGTTTEATSETGEPTAQGQQQAGGSGATDAGTSDANTAETVGIVLMGVGGVGLVVGTIFGVDAMQKDSDADELCGEKTCESEKGANLSKDANDAALISTIGFVAGGGALVAGALVYFLGGEDTAAANVRMSPVAGGAELGYAGRF